MIVNLLGLLDLWTGAIMLPMQLGLLPPGIILVHSIYLFVKGIVFWGDLYSMIDLLIAFYIGLMVLGISVWPFTIIAAAYLIFKAMMCLRSYA